MKIRESALLICSALLFTTLACKKTSSTNPGGPNSGTTPIRIQEGNDPDITNDTVYLIKYNASGSISTIIDSLNQDTITTTYDGNNNLTGWADTWGTSTSFTWSGNQLMQIDQLLAGSHEQFVYTYNGGVLTKVNYNSDLGSGGALNPEGYINVTFAGGNITELKSYSNGGTLTGDKTFTYGSEANPFKQLSLFDIGGMLGSDDIFDQSTWFNANLMTGFSQGGMSATSTFTFNANKLPTRVVTNDPARDAIFTWQFSYK